MPVEEGVGVERRGAGGAGEGRAHDIFIPFPVFSLSPLLPPLHLPTPF